MDEWTLRERFLTDAGAIAWDRFDSGAPVVMVHGTPWSSWTWRRIAPSLADRFEVWVFDLLGFGASEKRAGQDVSLAGHGARLPELLRHWGVERPAIVAHDIGGAIALRAHLLHGLAIRALALVNVVAVGDWGSPFYRLVGEHCSVFEQLPGAIHAGVLRAYLATAQTQPLPTATQEALMAPWLGAAGQSGFYRQIAQGDQRHTAEIEALYREIAVPTTVIWGESDPWIPIERGIELAQLIPDARFVRIPGAGHLVQEDTPEQLLGLLAEHLLSV
jgi:pimeloyl-ACP methyl ester carboxylesterase